MGVMGLLYPGQGQPLGTDRHLRDHDRWCFANGN